MMQLIESEFVNFNFVVVIDDAGLIHGQTQCTQGACFCQQDQDGALPAAKPGGGRLQGSAAAR